ncbi:MAG: energy transducer TonB [Terracidiphilus sp.]
MKSGPESVLWLVAVYGLAFGVAQLEAQPSNAPTSTAVGPQAVKVVLKQFTINQLASDPNTHHPLRTDGSWSISKNRPVACSQAATTCVEVFYEVPDQSAKCSWVISLDESDTDGKVLDENDDAESYMVRTLTGSEATSFVKSRSKPVVPPIALAVHVSGTVAAELLVGKAGDVQKVSSVNGPPMLQAASIDAAKKWTFMPMTIGTRTVQYQVPLVFTFYPWIASMPGAIKTTP